MICGNPMKIFNPDIMYSIYLYNQSTYLTWLFQVTVAGIDLIDYSKFPKKKTHQRLIRKHQPGLYFPETFWKPWLKFLA